MWSVYCPKWYSALLHSFLIVLCPTWYYLPPLSSKMNSFFSSCVFYLNLWNDPILVVYERLKHELFQCCIVLR